MVLRLTFGGTPCPSLWGIISDTLIETANTLIQNKHRDHNVLFDPVSNLKDDPSDLPESIPFGQAKDLMIDILSNNLGFTDIHIDDSIGLVSAIDDNPLHINRAIQLAIKTFTHLLVPNGHAWI